MNSNTQETKSRTMPRALSWAVLIALVLCFLGTAAAAFSMRAARESGSVRVLRLGHGLPTDHPVHKAMAYMSTRLKELSNGTMEIQIYPSGMIGSEDECFKQAQNAQIELSKCSSAVLDGSVPEFKVIGAPFLYRDSEHFWKVMDGEIGQSILGKIDGLVGLCYFDAGARSLYTTKKKVRSVEDMKGLKIRTQNSSIAMKSMSALGAAPSPIPWGELYTALSQGTVDAAENNLPSFISGRHYEVCKYFERTEHQRVPDVLVMSAKIWNELNDTQRGWLKQAASDASVYQRKVWHESEIESEKTAREDGVEFIDVDRSGFIKLSQPVYDDMPQDLRDMAARIKEVQ